MLQEVMGNTDKELKETMQMISEQNENSDKEK